MPYLHLSKTFVKYVAVIIIIIIGTYYIGNLIKFEEEKIKIENFVKEGKIEKFVSKGKAEASSMNSFISVLEIPKIDLKKGLYDINSPLNNVNKNIEINKKSDMPNKKNGNFILEAHSGYSFVSYFKNLEKLTKGDSVKVYYDNVVYLYEIDNFYDIPKTGKARIKRDYSKNTITLITCKKNEDKQIVYIGYLKVS